MEGENHLFRNWSQMLNGSSFNSTSDSDGFVNLGGISVIDRNEEQNTLRNDITLEGLSSSQAPSMFFRNSPQDTLSDLFGPTSVASSRIDLDDLRGLPSLEEAAGTVRNTPLDQDLISTLVGLSVNEDESYSSAVQSIRSSHKSLSWFNVGLHGESLQDLVFSNDSAHKSINISIRLEPNVNCFKIVNDNQLVNEIQISLEPRANSTISVLFQPVTRGQITSQLVVTYGGRRIHIPLYAYGGISSVGLSKSILSSELGHVVVLLPIETLTASFVLHNYGDEEGIFAIQNAGSNHCSVTPSNGVVTVRSPIEVRIRIPKFNISSVKLNGRTLIAVEKLTLIVEDRATRLRIERMKQGPENPLNSKYRSVIDLNDDPKTSVIPEPNSVFILVCIEAEEVKRLK